MCFFDLHREAGKQHVIKHSTFDSMGFFPTQQPIQNGLFILLSKYYKNNNGVHHGIAKDRMWVSDVLVPKVSQIWPPESFNLAHEGFPLVLLKSSHFSNNQLNLKYDYSFTGDTFCVYGPNEYLLGCI